MRVMGLVVGVDLQLDPEIEQLPFAGADAEWLQALLADLNEHDPDADEGDVVLLRAETATRAGVLSALKDISARSRRVQPDLIVVHFSCHGTPEGQLLMADAVAGQEAETGLALAEVTGAIEEMTAAHVVSSFDACFSGRAIATASQRARDPEVDARMQALAGDNRAVITAACANQRARESPRHGHGLLSLGLIEGLDGHTLAQGGTVSIARWVQYAAEVVAREAGVMGVHQQAAVYCRWQGAGSMPAVGPGKRTRALLARGDLHQVGRDIGDLAIYGFPAPYLDALRKRTNGNPLNEMQQAAINEGHVLANGNVLVSAPTTSGKTLVGELAALSAALQRRRAVVLLPSRALVAEKWAEFQDAFGPLGLRAVRSYGGVDDDDAALFTNHFDVAFLTYEKFLLLVLMRPRLLDALSTVVLDEVHLLRDAERGRSVEILLTLLRYRTRHGSPVQLVALSAALGTTNGLEEWLNAKPIRETQRPVPLREGVISPAGRFHYRDPETGEEGVEQVFAPIPGRGSREWDRDVATRVAIALAKILTEDPEERVLMFRAQKPPTRLLATELGRSLGLGRCEPPLQGLNGNGTGADTSRASRQLTRCLEAGVAFHLGDLEQPEREVIEQTFRAGDLRCLVATSGLAMGINTPATSVVVVDHKRWTPATGDRPYEVTEYRNMAGRAGRWIPGGRPGNSYLIAADERVADELFDGYVLGKPEPLESRLSELDRADLLLSLLAFVPQTTEAGLLELAADTFDGFVNGQDPQWRQRFRDDSRQALANLVRHGFIARSADGGITTTERGRICGRESLSVASAIRVVEAAEALAGQGEAFDEVTLIGLAQITEELDATPTVVRDGDAMGWPALIARQVKGRDNLVRLLSKDQQNATARLKRFFTMMRWVQGERMERLEEEFCRFREGDGQNEPSAGMIRQIAARTGHVLRSLGAIVADAYPECKDEIRRRIVDLQTRLEFGIDRDSAALARHRLGITRGQIHRLRDINRATFDTLYDGLKNGDPEVLAIFGSALASNLKGSMDQILVSRGRQTEINLAARLRLFDDLPVITEV
jgi:superfamily II DNA/RNA helicase